jgi:ribosome-binding protein aMBF1 (putative translation factor)
MSASEQDRVLSGQENGASDIPSEREALLEQIEETREELGATVEALAHKADVKAQVHEKVEEGKEQLQQIQNEATGKLRTTLDGPTVPAAIAAAATVLLLISTLRSRSRR